MPKLIDVDKRRHDLAAAVWTVVRERGIGAVSVRTVAAEAGVAVGSLRHVFPTRTELVLFSAELMLTQARERINSVPRSGVIADDALAVLRELLPLSPDARAELEVNLALIAEAPAVPELSGIRDRATAELAELCTAIAHWLMSGGADAPTSAAATRAGQRLYALVDGLALHLLSAPADADPTWAVDILRDEISRLQTPPSG